MSLPEIHLFNPEQEIMELMPNRFVQAPFLCSNKAPMSSITRYSKVPEVVLGKAKLLLPSTFLS